jgi:hypothetical protein
MSILKLISEPPKKRAETVTFERETYTLSGYPDTTKVQHIVLMTPSERERKARHWSKLTGSDFTEKMVLHVMFVTETLEHEDDPELRYDEVEIARLSTVQAGLFLLLVGAACKVLGVTNDGADGIDEMLAGESEGETPTSADSPS